MVGSQRNEFTERGRVRSSFVVGQASRLRNGLRHMCPPSNAAFGRPVAGSSCDTADGDQPRHRRPLDLRRLPFGNRDGKRSTNTTSHAPMSGPCLKAEVPYRLRRSAASATSNGGAYVGHRGHGITEIGSRPRPPNASNSLGARRPLRVDSAPIGYASAITSSVAVIPCRSAHPRSAPGSFQYRRRISPVQEELPHLRDPE